MPELFDAPPRVPLAKLQDKWRKLNTALRAEIGYLDRAYGRAAYAPESKRRKLEALRARESAASDAIFAWLDAHSPRSWRSGVAAYWVCDQLTEADALTRGALSVVPSAGYGSNPSQVLHFARALDASA